ncbi:unnamed protein product [Staurois parvus]|uniref:Uncharacterized protein n=1 Tax=Staurois parvus TaxID=386267 RepID=A0ABN9CVE9_9NEOB|nr:unnamed protein product [Staurois parvus]
MILTLVVSQKNALYIGCQSEECSLHWSSVGRMLLTFGSQQEECPLHWWFLGRMYLTWVISGRNAPYIGDQ